MTTGCLLGGGLDGLLCLSHGRARAGHDLCCGLADLREEIIHAGTILLNVYAHTHGFAFQYFETHAPKEKAAR